MACIIIGALTFTYGVTQVSHILRAMKGSKQAIRLYLHYAREWAVFYSLPIGLLHKVQKFLLYRAEKEYYDESRMLNLLSKPLRIKVLRHIYMHHLAWV